MPNDLNRTAFLNDIFSPILLLPGSINLVIAKLNTMPITSTQKIDIMIQWLDAYDFELISEIAEQLKD